VGSRGEGGGGKIKHEAGMGNTMPQVSAAVGWMGLETMQAKRPGSIACRHEALLMPCIHNECATIKAGKFHVVCHALWLEVPGLKTLMAMQA